ncbi:MAG: hypothetical protein Q4A82_02195 [Corynebacterium sp.]|nr:hypothetical protein [Corynebacterium sp.]
MSKKLATALCAACAVLTPLVAAPALITPAVAAEASSNGSATDPAAKLKNSADANKGSAKDGSSGSLDSLTDGSDKSLSSQGEGKATGLVNDLSSDLGSPRLKIRAVIVTIAVVLGSLAFMGIFASRILGALGIRM